MATIYQHKNYFFPHSTHHPQQQLKASHKLKVSSNLFATEYHIKEVHVLQNSIVLYETLKNNSKHIIHQLQIDSQSQDSRQALIQLVRFAEKPHVDHVCFETNQVPTCHFSQLDHAEKLQQILKILQSQEKLKCQIILNSSVGLQHNLNQKLLKQDFLSVLNQFLTFINSFHQTTQNLENSLLLRNSSTSTYVIHPLNIFASNQYSKLNPIPLQNIIKQYLLIKVSKNLKDLLNFRSKSIQALLKLYEAKHSQTQFAQFTSLLLETVTNKQKFTHKMLTCYIQILIQKYLKSKEQKQIFRHLSNHQSVHQPAQKDYSHQRRQKQSNSFIYSNDQKTKSLSRKLQVNKENNITEQNQYRRSDGPKSSSMVSMSPNRKNRKYMKCTNTSLFSNKNQSFQRTSSTSFLFKTTNGFNRNSSSSSLLDKNYMKTSVPNTQSNFFKNFSAKQQATPESNVKGYLEMMGFKSKANDSLYKKSDSIFEPSQKCGENERIVYNPSHEVSNVTESRLLSQSSFGRPEIEQESDTNHKDKKINELRVENSFYHKEPMQKGSVMSDADEKKLRLKQSLNMLSRKSLKTDNFISSNSMQIEEPKQQVLNKKREDRHNSIIPESEATQSVQRLPLQSGPVTATVIHKDRPTDEIVYEKSSKFKMCRQNQMNLKIKACGKSKQLKIDRSTVMVMHLVNLDRRLRTQSTNKSLKNQKTSRQKDEEPKEEFKERKAHRQMSFKPSLANVKKQKPLQKSQKIEKPVAYDSLSNHSVLEQKNEKPIQQKIPTNKSLNEKSQSSKSKIETLKQLSQADNLETSYLTKSNTSGLLANQSQNTTNSQLQQFQLSKQFFKQIFLFINSENKTLVDLLESKLSYEITFYAFYINYFKLNVNKSATKQSIDRMKVQINDYEDKIKQSQKISSKQKMLVEFQPFVKKLLSLNMESFVEKFWKKDELKPKDKENTQKVSEEVDKLTTGILKITMKIIQGNTTELRCSNQKQLAMLVKGLKICTTIGQLVYSVQNKLITLTSAQLKKISQTALETHLGYEKQSVETIKAFQDLINTYNGWAKQAETDCNLKINTKNENKKLWSWLDGQ